MDKHKTIAPRENNPGHINIKGSVEIRDIIIVTSTVLSQKISKIPPKVVGRINRAKAPSKASKKKRYKH
jgi:2,3-bisphosphoglycerate-independent phosphoglycerate mutase